MTRILADDGSATAVSVIKALIFWFPFAMETLKQL
jgi:hypothetical protein